MWIKYRLIWEAGPSEYNRMFMIGNPTNLEIVNFVQEKVEFNNYHNTPGYSHFEWNRVSGDEEVLLHKIHDTEEQIKIFNQNLEKLYKKLNGMSS